MPEQNKRKIIRLIIPFLVILLVGIAVLTLINSRGRELNTEYPDQQINANTNSLKPLAKISSESQKNDAKATAVRKKISLKDIIRKRKTWNPILASWYGKMAPDFTLTDITGKVHKLSSYRGKNVLINFWATWCGPCIMEIPHLKALRKVVGEDKLAMLAISYESPELVKKTADAQKINYAVLSYNLINMPAPFNRVTGFPCSFFIDPQGKIKLVVEGALSLGEMKAILQAE